MKPRCKKKKQNKTKHNRTKKKVMKPYFRKERNVGKNVC